MIKSTPLSLPSNSSTISPTNFPSQLHMCFYFLNPLNPPNAGLYVLVCRTIFWSMGGLLPHPWRKLTLPTRQLSIVSSFSAWAELHEHMLAFCLVWSCVGLEHIVTAILSSCVQWPCLVQQTLPCCRLPLCLALTFFPLSLLWRSLRLERRSVVWLAYLVPITPHFLMLCTLTNCLHTSCPIL